ncbi:MAG: hypothetical protein NWE84_00900 [Candidatus Bathyarchaeota archaeon]|nr:hypothetical protein [Candidatus Bathyarchaeota archaeon]
MLPHVEQLLSERTGMLSVDKMRNWLKTEEGIILSPWKTRQIKGAMELENQKLFDQLKTGEKPEKLFTVRVPSPDRERMRELRLPVMPQRVDEQKTDPPISFL